MHKDFFNNEIKIGDYLYINDGERHAKLGRCVGFTKTMVKYIDGRQKFDVNSNEFVGADVSNKMGAYTLIVNRDSLANLENPEGYNTNLKFIDEHYDAVVSEESSKANKKSNPKSKISV